MLTLTKKCRDEISGCYLGETQEALKNGLMELKEWFNAIITLRETQLIRKRDIFPVS